MHACVIMCMHACVTKYQVFDTMHHACMHANYGLAVA